MKRQTGSGSVSMDAREEEEQNERNETKRLKLLHRSDSDQPQIDQEPSHSSDADNPPASCLPGIDSGEINLATNESDDSFIKPKNGVMAKNIDVPNGEPSPRENGTSDNQHSLFRVNNTESFDHSKVEEDNPDQANLNGNASMNFSQSEFSFILPKYILEDNSGDSSRSDTDIENSPSSGNESSEMKKGNLSETTFNNMSEENLGESSNRGEKSLNKSTNESSERVLPNVQKRIWNFDVENLTSSLLKVTKLEGHSDSVLSVAADEDMILSSSADTTIKVWNATEKREICSFRGHSDAVTSVILLSKEQSKALSAHLHLKKGLRLAMSASIDCYIKLWSVSDGEELMTLYTFNGVTCMCYVENQFSVVIGTDGGKLELWNFSSNHVNCSIFAHEDSISALQVSDTYVYSASVDGSVKVWLVEENEFQPLYTRRRKELSLDKQEFHPTQWKSLAIHEDILYLGDNTGNIKVLDWRAGRIKLHKNQTEEDLGITHGILAKNNILLTTCYEANSSGINVWQLPGTTYICTITGPDLEQIYSLDMTQTSGGMLRIVSGGRHLMAWDFDFASTQKDTPSGFDTYRAYEIEDMGNEVENERSNEFSPISKNMPLRSVTNSAKPDKSSSWCNVM